MTTVRRHAPPAAGYARRVPQLLLGLATVGLGVALLIRADLGAAPWDVLHQGVALHTPLSIGTAAVVLGLVVFLGWLPLRQRPGAGTIANLLLVGPSVDLFLWLLPEPGGLALRVTELLLGTLLFGVGAGLYIAAGMGPGPRDGLMTGLAARGLPIAWVRTGLEVTALLAGWALGGTVGVGTLLVAVSVGHIVEPVLRWTTPGGEVAIRWRRLVLAGVRAR